MSTWSSSVGAITLFTEDLAAAKAFYLRVFGLPIIFENDDSAVFKIGGTMINLLSISQANELIEPAKVGTRDAGSRIVFSVEVDDVDAMCAKLVGLGVTLLNGPIDRPWGIRTASFCDPSGHIWEIGK